jgi:hypothetical protein
MSNWNRVLPNIHAPKAWFIEVGILHFAGEVARVAKCVSPNLDVLPGLAEIGSAAIASTFLFPDCLISTFASSCFP